MPKLDAAASKVLVRTRAKGLLAKLAHDLEIRCATIEGEVTTEDERWTAKLRFPVSGLRVVGVIKGGRVDETVLSSGDVAEIERKIRREVLPLEAIDVDGEGADLKGSLTVRAPRGSQRVDVRLDGRDVDGGWEVRGTTALSLKRLGIAEIKGPLGAFKVDDRVEIEALLRLVD